MEKASHIMGFAVDFLVGKGFNRDELKSYDIWKHYYNIASARPELKEFKDFLQVHYNKPHINMGENKITYEVKKEVQTDEGPKIIKETITKTVNQLLKELSPTNDSEGNNI